jgi:23S rRNA pseudouridine1911/1915/1917 synthase
MTMEGSVPSQRQIVRGGEQLHLLVPKEAPQDWQPQSLPLQVVYEDRGIVVIDKPAGLVVHPGAGNPDSTLANAILHHYPENRMLARAGLVHRLDKGTTGLLVVARTGQHPVFRVMMQYGICQCAVRVASTGVNNQSGRLVDHHNPPIFIHHLQRQGLRLPVLGRLLWHQ